MAAKFRASGRASGDVQPIVQAVIGVLNDPEDSKCYAALAALTGDLSMSRALSIMKLLDTYIDGPRPLQTFIQCLSRLPHLAATTRLVLVLLRAELIAHDHRRRTLPLC